MRFFARLQPHPKIARLLKVYGVIYICLVFVLGSFILGWDFGAKRERESPQRDGKIVGELASPPAYLSKDVNFNLYWNVLEAIKNKSINQPVNEVKLFYGSLAGMVAALGDPYSVFLEPQISKEFTQELSGEFFGIGAEVGIKDGYVTVISPLEDSPAERAGLTAGSKILAINGVDAVGMPLDVAVSKIRGPKGTKVTLTITKNGLDKAQDIVLIRDIIVIKTVRLSMLENNTIAHIKISQFNEDTISDFNRALMKVLSSGAKKIILDVRNNPGGFLDSAVNVAGEWAPNEAIVVERFASGDEQVYRSNGNARLVDFSTVVLVNGGSASGAEIVAGALQDFGKALLVGEKTFGKGSVQDFSSFPDGSSLKLTIAEWLTPKRRSINKAGIVPDIEVKPSEGDQKADKDIQLEKAIELLKR